MPRASHWTIWFETRDWSQKLPCIIFIPPRKERAAASKGWSFKPKRTDVLGKEGHGEALHVAQGDRGGGCVPGSVLCFVKTSLSPREARFSESQSGRLCFPFYITELPLPGPPGASGFSPAYWTLCMPQGWRGWALPLPDLPGGERLCLWRPSFTRQVSSARGYLAWPFRVAKRRQWRLPEDLLISPSF